MNRTPKTKKLIRGVAGGFLLLAIITVGAYLLHPGGPIWHKTVHKGSGSMNILPLSGMSRQADKIVYGTVVERGTSYFKPSGIAFTPVTVRVQEVLKGPKDLSTTIYLEPYGDFPTEIYHYHPDNFQPYPVQEDTQIVVFLNENGGSPYGGSICEIKNGIVQVNPYIEDAREISDTLEIPYKDFKTLIQGYLN